MTGVTPIQSPRGGQELKGEWEWTVNYVSGIHGIGDELLNRCKGRGKSALMKGDD